MTPARTRVHPLLLLVLAATAGWALLGGGPSGDEDAVELARPARSTDARPNAAAAALAAAPSARERGGAATGPAAGSWPAQRERLDPDSGRGLMGLPPAPPPPVRAEVPPVPTRPATPPAAVPAPPPPPAAPAGPPLLLMGVVKTDTPTPQVFFTLGDRLIQARVGETIDGRFRIESITAAKVVVTVLPDNNRVEIPLSTTTPGG